VHKKRRTQGPSSMFVMHRGSQAALFRKGSQASRADLHPDHLPVDHDPLSLDIRLEPPLGVMLRVAHTVSGGWSLTCNCAYSTHLLHLAVSNRCSLPQPEKKCKPDITRGCERQLILVLDSSYLPGDGQDSCYQQYCTSPVAAIFSSSKSSCYPG
jgi:hypothetical protein